MNRRVEVGQILLEAVEHLLWILLGQLVLDGMKRLLWPFVSPPNLVLNAAHQQSVMEDACTWCVPAAPATFIGAGCVRQSGHGSAWELTGLVES